MSNRARAELFAKFDAWGFDERGWSKTTRRRYFERARAADEWLVTNRGVGIFWASPKDLQAYLFSTPPTARNRNNIRQALVGFGDYLVSHELAAANNAQGLPRLPEPELLPKALEEEAAIRIDRVARTLHIMPRTAIQLMLYGGLRRSEVRLLEWSHVDPDAAWLHFPEDAVARSWTRRMPDNENWLRWAGIQTELMVRRRFRQTWALTIGHSLFGPPWRLPASDQHAAALAYVRSANANIRLFLRDKTHKAVVQLEAPKPAFSEIWSAIGAAGDLGAALAEFDVRHNAS